MTVEEEAEQLLREMEERERVHWLLLVGPVLAGFWCCTCYC